MKGIDVCGVLKRIGVRQLHHANSVATTSTFLEQGGLASRKFVEDRGLNQTPQFSDDQDRKYGIWNSIFLDQVDIHDRAGRKKGPNQYGPVLFLLDLDTLLVLPAGTDVLVTKMNPIYWKDNDLDSDRWFRGPEELAVDIHKGDFAQMVVIQTPSGRLDFPSRRARIILDDPLRQLSSGEKAYSHAENQLKAAAAAGRVEASIERRKCGNDCICVKTYATYPTKKIDSDFT